MSKANNGGPAFPFPAALYPDGSVYEPGESGMTLRDYFAAKAMSFCVESFEEIAGIAHKAGASHQEGFFVSAKFAYQIADAMLRAREAA